MTLMFPVELNVSNSPAWIFLCQGFNGKKNAHVTVKLMEAGDLNSVF